MRPRIAIIGGGVAGMGAARVLVRGGYDVTIFETLPRLGGDCFGVDVQLPGRGMCRIDAGVGDFNVETFVRVKALLDDLKLEYRPIVQDASFMTPAGETLYFFRDGALHQRQPLPDTKRFRAQIARFNQQCPEVLSDSRFADWTTQKYLETRDYSPDFARLYVFPRAMGCFPMPNANPGTYPIRSLVSFWNMHGIVGARGPAPRMCVAGGMHQYCDAFARWFKDNGGEARCCTRVVGIVRRVKNIEVRAITRDDNHIALRFDHVIVATNPNEVVPLLEDPSHDEQTIFGEFPYQRARLAVHTDARLMPKDRATWGSYNYVVASDEALEVRPTLSFYPNLMTGLDPMVPDVFVTMNPHIEPEERRLICNRFFEHPVATGKTADVTARLAKLQGRRNTWFAGSYLREPFVHEQALCTGEDIALELIDRDRV